MYKSLTRSHPLHAKARFVPSPLTEASYAMRLLQAGSGDAGGLEPWVEQQRIALGNAFMAGVRRVSPWPMTWVSLLDTAPHGALGCGLTEAIERIADIAPEDFARDVLEGLLHHREGAVMVLSGSQSLREAVNACPRSKREWLIYAGLYPHRPDGPAAALVRALRNHPEAFRHELLSLLGDFWDSAFRHTWAELEAPLAASVKRAQERWTAGTPQAFAEAYHLRAEIDDRKRFVGAIRGGARIGFGTLAQIWFMPSVFNVQHLWHVRPLGRRQVAYFPYRDPAIQRQLIPDVPGPAAKPGFDPALVFKALGDSTRYAIMLLLARNPRTMSELAAELGLSKATISHHTYLLREAELLTELSAGRATILGVRRQTLAALSGAALQALDRQAIGTDQHNWGQSKYSSG